MKKMMTLMLCCCMTQMAVAQADGDAAKKEPAKVVNKEAQDILKKVDATIKEIKTVRYDVSAKGTGTSATRVPEISGSMIQHGVDNNPMAKFFFDGTVKRPGSAESRRITGGTDGDLSFLIDYGAKMVYEDIDPAVMGSDGRILQQSVMLEFTHPKPFSDEINAETIEMLDAESVAGVDCFKIKVKYANNAQEATWYFGKKDFLPRRVDRHFPARNGGTTMTITNLEVDPKLDAKAYSVKVPEGFEKTDEFAPMRQPPQPVTR